MSVQGVVLGSGAVGKSALTMRFIRSHFVEEYEDAYQKTVEVDMSRYGEVTDTSSSSSKRSKRSDSGSSSEENVSEVVTLDLLDTAGQEEYSAMRDQYMQSGECFVLVFSITCRDSFDAVAEFAEMIARVKDCDVQRVPLVLVGNKSDLSDHRSVSSEEAQALAQHLKCPYYERSALTGINVHDPFLHVTARALRARKQQQEQDMQREKDKKKDKRRGIVARLAAKNDCTIL